MLAVLLFFMLLLLLQAFAEGRFPPGVSSKDFVRIDDSKRRSSADGWTPEDTMLCVPVLSFLGGGEQLLLFTAERYSPHQTMPHA
jgi:hypothetical protein